MDALPKRGNIALGVALLVAALCTASLPNAPSLTLLSVLFAVTGLAMGCLDTAANVLMIATHSKGNVDPVRLREHLWDTYGVI